MKVEIKQIPNPVVRIILEATPEEVQEMECWMGNHTGPEAPPTSCKELIVALRKARGGNSVT